MTPEQREELKRAAMKATPGPWHKGPSGGIYTEGPDSFGILSALTPSGNLRNASANEEYAALADPSAILSLIAQVEALTVPQWISVADRLPDVPQGCEKQFIVACQRAHGKAYVFAADYLNAKLLMVDDDDCPEGGVPITGWHQERSSDGGDYDIHWERVCEEGDTITHFMPLPAAPTIPAIPGTKEGA